ncbi:13437_t:CDS:1, partial [Cetraspora pellucida]
PKNRIFLGLHHPDRRTVSKECEEKLTQIREQEKERKYLPEEKPANVPEKRSITVVDTLT